MSNRSFRPSGSSSGSSTVMPTHISSSSRTEPMRTTTSSSAGGTTLAPDSPSRSSSMVFRGVSCSSNPRKPRNSCSFALPSSSLRRESAPPRRMYACSSSSSAGAGGACKRDSDGNTTTTAARSRSISPASPPPPRAPLDTDLWNAKEHARFLVGLEQFAYGQCTNVNAIWYAIAAKVETRTLDQVKAHANRYFLQLQLVNSQTRATRDQEELGKAAAVATWTFAEDELFEDLLALYLDELVFPWDVMASKFPNRSPRDLQERYHQLCDDIARIERGHHVQMQWSDRARARSSSLEHLHQRVSHPQDPVALDAVVTLTSQEEAILSSALEETHVPSCASPELLAAVASAMTCLCNFKTKKLAPQRQLPAFSKTDAKRTLQMVFAQASTSTARQNASKSSSSKLARAIVVTLVNELQLFPTPRSMDRQVSVKMDRMMPPASRRIRNSDVGVRDSGISSASGSASASALTSASSRSTPSSALLARPTATNHSVLPSARRSFQPSQSPNSFQPRTNLSNHRMTHARTQSNRPTYRSTGHSSQTSSSPAHASQQFAPCVSGVARERRPSHEEKRPRVHARRYRMTSPRSSPVPSIASSVASLPAPKLGPPLYVTASGLDDFI